MTVSTDNVQCSLMSKVYILATRMLYLMADCYGGVSFPPSLNCRKSQRSIIQINQDRFLMAHPILLLFTFATTQSVVDMDECSLENLPCSPLPSIITSQCIDLLEQLSTKLITNIYSNFDVCPSFCYLSICLVNDNMLFHLQDFLVISNQNAFIISILF